MKRLTVVGGLSDIGRWLLAIVLAASPGPARSEALGQTHGSYITLRLVHAPSDRLINALARISQPVEQNVPANTQPEDAIRSFCGGSFTQTYYKIVLDLNQPWGKQTKARPIKLPACPNYHNQPEVTVQSSDTLDTILRREMGVGRNDMITTCDVHMKSIDTPDGCVTIKAEQAVVALNGGAKAGLDQLHPGNKLTLPSTTRWTMVHLLPTIKPQDAILVVSAEGGQARVLYAPGNLDLIKPVAASDDYIKGTTCDPDSPAPTQPWPFDATRVRQAIERSLARIRRQIIPTTVRIADAGVEGLDQTSYFPAAALAVNEINGGRSVDVNGVGRLGIDAGKTGDVAADPNYQYHKHGTEVADLALGGFEFRKNYAAVYQLVNLSFARVVEAVGASDFQIPDAMLSWSLTAKPPLPVIVNFSVGGSNLIPNFYTTMSDSLNVPIIAVVAAGNTPSDIENESDAIYPASYGGRDSPFFSTMIVVGAQGPDGLPTRFSSYGRNRVDILAPGCRIPFVGPKEVSDWLDGTSFSAPLVSFTAALIHALGMDDWQLIKGRIIAAADYDPRLEPYVISGSRLNIDRAIALYDDVLARPDGPDLIGTWNHDDEFVDLCQDQPQLRAGSIMRIDVTKADDTTRLAILLMGDHGRYSKISCAPSGAGLQFQPTGQTSDTVPWDSVKALTPASLGGTR